MFLQIGDGLLAQIKIRLNPLNLTDGVISSGLGLVDVSFVLGLGCEPFTTSVGEIGFEPFDFLRGL